MYNTAHHLYIKYISNYVNVYIISIKRGPQVEFIEWKKRKKEKWTHSPTTVFHTFQVNPTYFPIMPQVSRETIESVL